MRGGYREGKGTLTFDADCDEKIYKGYFSKDQFQGQGELLFKKGDIYRGKFINSVLDGQSEILTDDYSFVGEVKKGVIEGKGSIKYTSGDLYQGEFSFN